MINDTIMRYDVSYNQKPYITFASHALDHAYDKREGHTHHHFEISIIREGSGIYYINGERVKAEKGDIFVFNNTDLHGLSMSKEETIINQVIHFEPWLIWHSPQDFFNYKYLKIFLNRPSSFRNKIPRNQKVSESLVKLFDEMLQEFEAEDIDYELMIKVKLLNMLVLLSRHYRCDNSSITSSPKDLEGIQTVIHYIQENYSKSITLKELANLIYMNPSYFSRYFKRYNGLSPMDYLAHIRIRHAVNALITSTDAVVDISYACGFNSITSFNRTFKRIEGISPTTYRKVKINY